jgi:site-specific DNA-methyltransferase (adenine-specific)
MVLCDLPYGTTACSWDSVISLNRHILVKKGKKLKAVYLNEYLLETYKKGIPYQEAIQTFNKTVRDGLWDNYKRIIKDNGVIVLFGSQPFTTKLISSNMGRFKYSWIWDKVNGVNLFNLKNRPFKTHEDIIIFADKPNFTFNPLRIMRTKSSLKRDPVGTKRKVLCKRGSKVSHYGFTQKKAIYKEKTIDGKRHPIDIIKFNLKRTGLKQYYNSPYKHPTQKPLALCEYLIKTYTNEGDIVLDNTAGSGTTGVAARNLRRDFIMIEQLDEYVKIIEGRLNEPHFPRMFVE